ncbi:MAG: alpha-L-fucosidase [Oligosphaeraceae bacterium]
MASTPRKRRQDALLGIHFDFHALPGQTVPTLWRPETYAEMLDAVQPDFVQCDTKGHAGLSSYPTRVGHRALLDDRIDILRMMRDETARRNIPLFAHHSGIYDQMAAQTHPDWRAVGPDGTPSSDVVSVFSPFAEQLLLPQLRELAADYRLDGAWIDGECWAARVDYSHWALEAYQNAGNTLPPPRPGDPGYDDYREFCRQGFKDYVQRYLDAIHREFPHFQITSNWMWSAYMPEQDTDGVDFLSGDYSSTDSVLSARTHGRILEARRRPWDLMAWGHQAIPCSWTTRNRQTKCAAQYCQEAAMILAMGGAFEFFNIHYGCGGAIQQWAIPTWRQTADFCRQRSRCLHASIRPEIGVLFPCDRNSPDADRLYGGAPGLPRLTAWLNLLQDAQLSTKVILQHQLDDPTFLSRFKAIVIPAAHTLPPTAIGSLLDFTRHGGALLLDLPALNPFAPHLGCQPEPAARHLVFVHDGDGALAAGETDASLQLNPTSAHPVADLYLDNLLEPALRRDAACVQPLGSGRLAALALDLAHFYQNNRSPAIRRFLLNLLLRHLRVTPDVAVTGSHFAELTVTDAPDGTLLVNLINRAGEHQVTCVRAYDEIPPLPPLTVTFSPALAPVSVLQLPENRPLELRRHPDGSASVTVPSLDIHTVLVTTLA